MSNTPNRGTSEQQLDQWNIAMRSSPVYQDFMRSRGLSTDGRVSLSRGQQSDLERSLATSGVQIPGGMHIDQGGNLNQQNRLVRNIGIGAAATGAALTGFGLAGLGPLSGLGGSAAAGAGGAAGAASGAGAAASGAAAGATGMNLGSILGSNGFGALVNGGLALLGNRSNNNAARYAADIGARTSADALALQRQQLEEERSQWQAQQAEAKRQWDAQQAQYAQQWAAQQDDRQYQRSQNDYQRSISDYNLSVAKQREARRAPYLAMSQQALASLGQMLGLH